MKNWLSHLFNIAPHEWPRVIYAWTLEFWLMGAHVLGHALLIAVAASEFGAGSLPVLWIVAAILTVMATGFLAPLLMRFEKKKLILSLGMGAFLSLGMAFLGLEMTWGAMWFLGWGLLGMAGLGGMMHIVVGLQVEDLFSPLEAERTFPIVSSSALIAALIVGGAISILTGSFWHWGVWELVMIWGGLFGMAILTQVIWDVKGEGMKHVKEEVPKQGLMADLKEAVSHLRSLSFAKKLAGVVMLQLVVVQLLEFQWATALAADSHGNEGHLIHGLGKWGAVAAGVALIFQILWSRKAVHKLGIVRTQMINPVFIVAPFLVLLGKFGVGTAVTAKVVHDSTQALAKNAYLASFYVIPEKIREQVKPLLEGWLAPLGAIFGTGLLLVLEKIWTGEHGAVAPEVTKIVSVMLIGLAVILIWKMAKLGKSYTNLSVRNLRSGDLESRKLAAEILAQAGHKNGTLQLARGFAWASQDPEIKAKILEVMGNRQDPESIPVILEALIFKDEKVKKAALKALSEFDMLDKHFEGQVFARHRIKEVIKNEFKREKSGELKQGMVKIMAKLKPDEVAPWLIEVLKDAKKEELIVAAIEAVSGFHDASCQIWLKGFLNHRSPKVRAAVISGLWQFGELRMELLAHQIKLLNAKKTEEKRAAAWLISQVKNKAERDRLERWMKEDDPELRLICVWGLCRMGRGREMEMKLAENLKGRNDAAKWILGLDEKTRKRVRKSLKRMG